MGKQKNRYLVLLVLALGAVGIYFLPYLRWTFYDTLFEAVGLTNTQFAATLSAYGVTSMIFYAPGGYLADKFSPRKMLTFAFAATGLLGLWFSTFPGFISQMIIYSLWGIIGTAFFWSAMLKVTNGLGSGEEQGRMFGLLEGGRGVVNVIISFVALYFYSKLGETVAGVTGIVIGGCILCFLGAVLTWFVVPDKINASTDKIQFKDVGKVLKLPAVWIIAIIVLSCYSVYIGSTYLTPYMTEVLGVSATISGAIAIVRSYVLQFAGGPTGGFIADKIGSVTFVISVCFVIIALALAGFVILPSNSSVMMVAVVLMLLFCVAIFAMRGIYFAPVDESGVPKNLVGTAIGVISVIGFFPDVYMNAVAGSLMDAFPGAQGYKYLFIVMLAFSIVGTVASFILNGIVKKQKRAKAEAK
ncbi:MAG TPA: MFS transporter [Firmicutes bacterium]|nr:MFS transporter [Bacillota bacterium]